MRNSKRFGIASFVLAIIAVVLFLLRKGDSENREAAIDKARSQELKAKIEARAEELNRIGETHWYGSPEYKAEAVKSKELYAEWHALNRKHPEWKMGRSYASDYSTNSVASGTSEQVGGK